MAFLNQISQISSAIGAALEGATSLLVPQTLITNKEFLSGSFIPVPDDQKNTVFLEVVKSEDMTLSVEMTKQPVVDLGSAIDYISKNPPSYSLTAIIANENLNALSDPAGLAYRQAGAAFPQVSATIDQASLLAGQYVDLGSDEIDQKIKQLFEWQTEEIPVDIHGIRLNIYRWIPQSSINWYIESISPSASTDTGNSVELNLTFSGQYNYTQDSSSVFGTVLTESRNYSSVLGVNNPFGGV